MLTPNKQCRVCKYIQADKLNGPKLEKDIYNSTAFVKMARRTILDIANDYPENFTYKSLRVHVRFHQTLSAVQIHNKNQTAIRNQKKREQQIANVKPNAVWDEVIKTGMAKLKDGDLEMRTADLLKATKDKSDYELKVKDQEMQMAEMVAYFASGEGDLIERKKYDRRIIEGETAEYFDPTKQLAADTERRTEQSRTFYQSLTGDAATPGTD